MRMKDIVKEIGKRVELTQYDLEKLKSGSIRWETRIRWAVFDLHKEGLIEKVNEGVYKIGSKGLDALKG